jgi:hypothetical protein
VRGMRERTQLVRGSRRSMVEDERDAVGRTAHSNVELAAVGKAQLIDPDHPLILPLEGLARSAPDEDRLDFEWIEVQPIEPRRTRRDFEQVGLVHCPVRQRHR